MNFTVGTLKQALDLLDDNMEVVIPIIDDEDNIKIHGFFNVNSVSTIRDRYSGDEVLLLAVTAYNKTIEEELSSSCATLVNQICIGTKKS